MNTSLERHIAEEVLETYALGKLDEAARAPLEEHLLLCPACQDRLSEMDEYIRVMRAAMQSPTGSIAGKSCA